MGLEWPLLIAVVNHSVLSAGHKPGLSYSEKYGWSRHALEVGWKEAGEPIQAARS